MYSLPRHRRGRGLGYIEGESNILVPVSGEYGGFVLSGGEACLQQKKYVENDYLSLWQLHEQNDYTLMYIGFMEGEETIQSVLNAVDTAMTEDAQMDGYASTSMSVVDLKRYLSSSKVFSCVTHGLQNSIECSDAWLTISDVNGLSDDAFDDLKLVYLGACNTGIGGSGADNLVNALYEKGADVVVGFTIEINVNEAYVWTQAFMESIALGNTIETALDDADYILRNDDVLGGSTSGYTVSEKNRYIRGSIYAIPCP